MNLASLKFNLEIGTWPSISSPLAARHTVTAEVSDSFVQVRTQVTGDGGVGWTPHTGELCLGGQWPQSIKRQLGVTKGKTTAPEFEIGNWKTVTPAMALHEARHSNYCGAYLYCDLRLEPANTRSVFWNDAQLQTSWMEVAESLNAASVGKNLQLRFVSVAPRGERRELRMTQDTSNRSARVQMYRNDKLQNDVSCDIEDYLQTRALVAFLDGYKFTFAMPSHDASQGDVKTRRRIRDIVLFRKPAPAPGKATFFFTPKSTDEGHLVSWTDHRVGGPTVESKALLQKLRALCALVGQDIDLPSDDA